MDRYEKALELARAYYDKDANAFLDTIFPELKESEDERIRKIITDSVFYQYGADKEYEDVLDYLDKLEKQKEQKPAEWSEEDETYLQDALWCVEKAEKSCKDEEDKGACWSAKRWLESLPQKSNLQPKQEWSEEDEKQIAQIERIVKNAGCAKMLQDKIHNWFKSLRPSWKPNEEQMKALQCAIVFMEIRKASDYDISPLNELYEQLKRL